MTFHWAQWGPPLVVLLVGVVAGLMYAWLTRGSDLEQLQVSREGREEDLLRSKDAVLDSLRVLAIEKDKLDPKDYEEQRRALLAKGADALRALDETKPAMPTAPEVAMSDEKTKAARALLESQRPILGDAVVDAALAKLDAEAAASGPAADQPASAQAPEASPASNGSPSISPAWQGAGWALLGVALVGALWYMLHGAAVPRRPGAEMTGNQSLGMGAPPSNGSQASASNTPKPKWPGQAELEARLDKNPNDIQALNGLTEIALGQQDLSAAMGYNTRALKIDKTNRDARVYFALLRMAIGQTDQALKDLDGVLAEEPNHPRALAYKGLILLNEGKAKEAIPPLEKAIAVGAPGTDALKKELQKAKDIASGKIPAPTPEIPPESQGTPSGPLPANHPGFGGPMAGGSGAPASGGEVLASGVINVKSGTPVSPSEVLFVALSDPAGGPPLAALKLPAGPFPMNFKVTSANVISMGGPRPVPATFNLSVRLDSDGNPMTHDPGDPSFSESGVSKGTTGIAANLQ